MIKGGFGSGIVGILKDLLAKYPSIKMRLLQAHGILVSFVLIVNFNDDIEFLNLLNLTRLKFPTVI